MLTFFYNILFACWTLLQQASFYILFGLLVGGMLKVFLSPTYVANHLGKGRFSSVFKAALLGIPIPLCSCGVLPAAASLKKQGANNGATTAFLISTPESGVDSISITWALLDPIMTIARPFSAFISALTAGVLENFLNPPQLKSSPPPDISCPIDNCCDGINCPPERHRNHHSFYEKIEVAIRYAVTDIWKDLVGWFFIGIILAGIITVLVPDNIFDQYLGGGLPSMLLMLAFGIPLYICATASTPIAAALIIKGVSPGTALVFLLVGPATNITSLSVLSGLLGKRATLLYLSSIAVVSVLCGLAVDTLYINLNIPVSAMVGQAREIIPSSVTLAATIILLILSVHPLYTITKKRLAGHRECGCSSDSCSPEHNNQTMANDHHCDCHSCPAADSGD